MVRPSRRQGDALAPRRTRRARDVDGLTFAEIGEQLGVSKWMALKIYKRALRKLREANVGG